jgi:AGZA family xanthine/uracil permease-like MFS transporter
MRPAFQMWETPWIGLACFAIVLIAWTANARLPGGLPGGLVAVLVGSAIGWIASLAGWSDYMKPAAVSASLAQFGLHLPTFSADVWTGLAKVAPLLATAIPLGIYNFTEAMNNVESASAAGDNYNLRQILLADGLGAIVGSMLGSPFPPAVYIGHPGWKAVGGRIGYSLATGVAIALVCFLGLTALLLALIPLVAILPILLYIGLVIGAQAFQASPAKHAPAIILALIPNIAEWAKTQVDGALGAAGTSAAGVGLAKLGGFGVLYKGLETVGGGSVLAGMVLGAIAVYVIDNRMKQAAAWAFAGAVLSYFGLIHGAQLGWAVSPLVALGYAMFAITCVVLMRGQPAAPAAAS